MAAELAGKKSRQQLTQVGTIALVITLRTLLQVCPVTQTDKSHTLHTCMSLGNSLHRPAPKVICSGAASSQLAATCNRQRAHDICGLLAFCVCLTLQGRHANDAHCGASKAATSVCIAYIHIFARSAGRLHQQLVVIKIHRDSGPVVQDRIASLNGRTVQYVIRQDKAAFVRLIGISVLQSAASAVLAPSLRHVADALAMTWRRRLTAAAHARYFKGNTFYTTSQLAGQLPLLVSCAKMLIEHASGKLP